MKLALILLACIACCFVNYTDARGGGGGGGRGGGGGGRAGGN